MSISINGIAESKKSKVPHCMETRILGNVVYYNDITKDGKKSVFVRDGEIVATVHHNEGVIGCDGGPAVTIRTKDFVTSIHVENGLIHRNDGPAFVKIGVNSFQDQQVVAFFTLGVMSKKMRNHKGKVTVEYDDGVYEKYNKCGDLTHLSYISNEYRAELVDGVDGEIIYTKMGAHITKYEFFENVKPTGYLETV